MSASIYSDNEDDGVLTLVPSSTNIALAQSGETELVEDDARQQQKEVAHKGEQTALTPSADKKSASMPSLRVPERMDEPWTPKVSR
jgi:hypothetical protein